MLINVDKDTTLEQAQQWAWEVSRVAGVLALLQPLAEFGTDSVKYLRPVDRADFIIKCKARLRARYSGSEAHNE